MRKLLVIADKNSGKQLAFYHAVEIAKATGAEIEFVSFVHSAGVDSSDMLTHDEKRMVRNKYLDNGQTEMDKFLASADISGIKLTTDVVWGKSFEQWVIARCHQKSFDMVFKSGIRKKSFLYTPSDWRLIRYCPEPVMIVGDSPWKKGGVILAALDLGPTKEKYLNLNLNILRLAITMGKATNCEVHAVYSMSISQVIYDLDILDPEDYERKMESKIDPMIIKMMEDAELDRSRLQLVAGKPAKDICRICNEMNADVVILGNKSHRSIRGRLLGNTAENILHKVSADVVVIK